MTPIAWSMREELEPDAEEIKDPDKRPFDPERDSPQQAAGRLDIFS